MKGRTSNASSNLLGGRNTKADSSIKELKPLYQRYVGPLSLEQIVVGIETCILNAINLFADAIILQKSKRYARALSLLRTSQQEAGKVELLKK